MQNILNYVTVGDNQNLKFAHVGDAGMDVIATSEPRIVGDMWDVELWSSIDYIEYDTGLHLEPAQNDWVMAVARSSISKYNLILCNSVGIIDTGYRGEVKFRFKYIIQPGDFDFAGGRMRVRPDVNKLYRKGDRIGQLIVMRHTGTGACGVPSIGESARGTGGFGSTGV